MIRQTLVNKLKDHVTSEIVKLENGESNTSAIDLFIQVKELNGYISDYVNVLKEHAIKEREKYNDKERIIRQGLNVDLVSTTRYSYPKDFSPYADSLAKKKHYENLMKQAITSEIADGESGELIPPAETKITTTIKLTRAE